MRTSVKILTMPDDRDLVAGVAQLANLLNRRLAPVLDKAGITPQQWGVLLAIGASAEAFSLAALARKLAVTKQNMTGMVDRLEQLGLIEREEDPTDLRSSRLKLSRRGRSALDRFQGPYEEWLRGLGGEREIEQLERSINRLISRLEES
jgi:DNA-binding MarR family transcriptional regulator